MLFTCPYCQTQQSALSTNCLRCGQTLSPFNPYAATVDIQPEFASATPKPKNLAGRVERFFARLLDGFAQLIAIAPGFVVMMMDPEFTSRDPNSSIGQLGIIGMLLASGGLLLLVIYQWIQISKTGQSLGKRMVGIRIVMLSTGAPPGFFQGVVVRQWFPALLGAIPCGIGAVFSLVNACFIFREDRRCIHDLWAKTTVVNGRFTGRR